MNANTLIFTLLFGGSMAFFAFSCFRRFSLVALGTGENRFSRPVLRFWNMLVYAFGQKRVLKKPFGLNHGVLFWSFLILLLANGEFLAHGLFSGVALSRLPDPLYFPLMLIFDIVSLLTLFSVLLAVIRRLLRPPYPEAVTLDAFIILSLIATLMIAYFNLHGVELAAGRERASGFMPISGLFATLFHSGITPERADGRALLFWWLHAGVLLIFLNYLPYSKHMHILAAIPNCFFRRFEKPNTQPREVFKKDLPFGSDSVSTLTWKDLFDGYACTECGRCQMACPAYVTGKALNPRKVIHDLKVNLILNGPVLQRKKAALLPLIGEGPEGSVSLESIWSCTTCGACMEVCPVFIEQMPKLVKMRRHLVEMKAEFPPELLALFENMEQRSNPWGLAPSERTKWCSQMKIPAMEPSCEYLFFVGCSGAYDSRNKQVTVALTLILEAAGVSFGILGKDELCCGDSLRRLGNEFVFEKTALENVKRFKEHGVKKIVTQCPHCYSTLKNDYRQYGFEAEVLHHTELIESLLASGRLKLKDGVAFPSIAYHDSCYLGRHNEVYSAPRNVLETVTGRKPLELERNRDNGFCCGAGGGRMWMEESAGTRINLERVEEALKSGAESFCVACPYCLTMYEDGLKDKGRPEIKVRDIAEVVSEGLRSPVN